MSTPADLLVTWLNRAVDQSSIRWLEKAIQNVRTGDAKQIAMAFSLASRKVGKADLCLSADDLKAAAATRPRWNPGGWTADQAARTTLVLSMPSSDPDSFVAILDRLFSAADFGELVALYQALPLYPHPTRHKLRAAEGLRSNMKAVFESVALRNPYPSEQCDEPAWNQMILKCLFVDSRLNSVIGVGGRANPTLAAMLVDYARERRAAHRPISPELWRCVGPFADEQTVDWLASLFTTGSDLDRQAAALALAACRSPKAKSALVGHPQAIRSIDDATWSWASIARQLDAMQISGDAP